MNPKNLLSSLLAVTFAATVPVRAQDVAQPSPGTVVVEHGEDRITIEFGAAGKPKVTHNGKDVAADARSGLINAYRYALKDYQLKVSMPKLEQAKGWWQVDRSVPTVPTATSPQWFAQQGKQAKPRPHIGVHVGEVTEALAYQLELDPKGCVLVLSVTENGPAAKAGLCANDIVLRVGERDRVTNSTLGEVLAECKAGESIEVEVLRRGERKVLTIEAAADPVFASRSIESLLSDRTTTAMPLDPRVAPLLNRGSYALTRSLYGESNHQGYQALRDEVKQLRAEWERLRKQLERDAGKADKRDR